jgi:hypothetical protein
MSAPPSEIPPQTNPVTLPLAEEKTQLKAEMASLYPTPPQKSKTRQALMIGGVFALFSSPLIIKLLAGLVEKLTGWSMLDSTEHLSPTGWALLVILMVVLVRLLL